MTEFNSSGLDLMNLRVYSWDVRSRDRSNGRHDLALRASVMPPPGLVVVQDTLKSDRVGPPSVLLSESQDPRLIDEEVPVSRYVSEEWHQLEMERLWSRAWQVACRVEELRVVGQHVLYELGDRSLIVVRSGPDRIQAFENVCLHRGTQLRVEGGTVNQFRCPFHGFRWHLDGTLGEVPSAWDFPDLDEDEMHLPEARVGIWGGFVFVNFDPMAPPLDAYLEIIPEQLGPFSLDRRYKAVHVSQVVPCNWKVALEAFIEGFHVAYTHPQSVRTFDSAVQYDVWPGVRHTSRLIQLGAAPSPEVREAVTDQEIVDAFGRGAVTPLSDGQRARPVVADMLRPAMSRHHRTDLGAVSDSEILDQIQYFIFPNLIPWPTVGAPLVYRFRPHGGPHQSLMEVFYLHPVPDDDPEPEVPAEIRLEPGQPWGSVPELGGYGPVFDQDMPNLARVQRGLRSTSRRTIKLSAYQESRIRHFHRTLGEYVDV
jgi:nitrite reductase/ring-hydroxylating ferredoxin subunit